MDDYRRKALELDAETFARLFEHPFLVRAPPSMKGSNNRLQVSPMEFRTETLQVARARLDDELGRAWLVEPVKKKPERPFPERVSIGRTLGCDITIRASYISKLHAYFICEAGEPLRLVDNKSANGTWVDGERLQAGRPHLVAVGARIKLGALELELLDARQLQRCARERASDTPE